ncbi:MAG: type I-E CRISPR-associated protein Cas6/Cse3/CasE [Betaproteobacteria bacterium]|nr:type I-E CRISPR-associated protein Cas6/Cse3/CasE [Betaproteobacteria bacterium]
MSHFSRIQLNERHPAAREALHRSLEANPYADHQWLWQFFPAPKGDPRDFLFRRMEPQGDRQQPLFYVVSSRPPQPVHAAWIVETRAYEPELERGARLGFDLKVNPVFHEMEERTAEEQEAYVARRQSEGLKIRPRPSKRKIYHDVVMHAKRKLKEQAHAGRWTEIGDETRPPLYELVHETVRDWFCGADGQPGVASRYGFSVDTTKLRVDAYGQHRVRREKAREIRFSTVDLTGELEVTDSGRFRETLLNGIGRAKAFGCGLLLVKRA